MRKFLLQISFILLSTTIQAAWLTSFEEAQKIALLSNKLIVVDFTAKWCGPCKEMDLKSWSDWQVEEVLQNYVKLRIDIDLNRDIALKYQVKLIPEMIIIDANGKIAHRFSGHQAAAKLRNELLKYSLSTEYLSLELVNFHKNKNFNSATRLSQKYLNYSLLVEKEIKEQMIFLSNQYLEEAREDLKKNDPNYVEKKQKLKLLSLYEVAYKFNFEKLEKKIIPLNQEKINESNQYQYWFLKFLALKGNNKSTIESEEFLRKHDLENVIENSNQLYGFYEKQLAIINQTKSKLNEN